MAVQQEELRYERKYLITTYSHQDVEQLIKFHPARFSEIYHARDINNIYFDTLGMNHYYDNVEGSSDRQKVRIRWYGELMGLVHQPALEYKVKKGLLGKKRSYQLQPFTLDTTFDKSQIEKALGTDTLPFPVRDEVLSLKPTLLNRYTRKYFLSADKKFRITIDYKLSYYQISYNHNQFIHKSLDRITTVLELKYAAADEQEAKSVSDKLPFSVTKSSKYLQGLERIVL
jgi:SPX domain protein involved in polyphosphate accumulation